MREFFRGWKRKVGCVTLVLACMFAGMWVRGHLIGDDFYFGSGKGTQFDSVRACRTGLNWKHDSSKSTMEWITGWDTSGIRTEDLSDPLRGSVMPQTYDWRWQWSGFDFGHAHDDSGDQTSYWLIPYWSIVAPLTAISAWLLLSKARSRPEPQIASASEIA